MKKMFGLVSLVLLSAACSPKVPEPSPRYDGRYVGSRTSSDADVCGTFSVTGRTSAEIHKGIVIVPLYPEQNPLEGTVGADGDLRASGMLTRAGKYPSMTVLKGHIDHDHLDGSATDLRCETDVHMIKQQRLPVPPRPPLRR